MGIMLHISVMDATPVVALVVVCCAVLALSWRVCSQLLAANDRLTTQVLALSNQHALEAMARARVAFEDRRAGHGVVHDSPRATMPTDAEPGDGIPAGNDGRWVESDLLTRTERKGAA
jgi:hypothetical protein